MKKTIFLLLFLLMGNLYATTYYVDTSKVDGDSKSGTSQESAWKTINKVNSGPTQGYSANDTISFKCGQRFSGNTLTPPRNNLIFNSYGSGTKPIIDGASTRECAKLDSSRSYITFTGIKFLNGYSYQGGGIALRYTSHITFDSCNIDSCKGRTDGANKYRTANLYDNESSYLILKNCTLSYGENNQNNFDGVLGIYLDGSDNCTMENDTLIGNFSNIRVAFGTDSSSKSTYTGAQANGLIVKYCIIKNGRWDNIDDDGSKGSQFYYNVFETSKVNLYLYADGSGSYNPYIAQNSGYYNNTWINRGSEASIHINTKLATNNGFIFKNNVFNNDTNSGYFLCEDSLGMGTGWVFDNNLYYMTSSGSHLWYRHGVPYSSLTSWKNLGLGYDPHSNFALPLFNNYILKDYSLQNSSPAIFAGDSVGLTQDILGRTVHNPPDAGAYQNINSTYLSGTISSNRTIGGNIAIVGNVSINYGVKLTLSDGSNIRLFYGSFISGEGYVMPSGSFTLGIQDWTKSVLRSSTTYNPRLLWGAYPGATGYTIYRQYSGTPEIVATPDANTFSWIDTHVHINGQIGGADVHYYIVANDSNSNAVTFHTNTNNPDKKLANHSSMNNIINFELSQNYPNPFNPTTVINYQLPEAGNVSLKIYDILGREVATLVNENKVEGSYDINFNSIGYKSGVYIYQLRVNDFISSKKMILLK